ncbi:M15 family metallopeptidase [Segetibacter sp.]|jgi:hypothetical protein|uniref:M15 family metallopeptidase n=1 Tax=Segetibacter sp. TaxID=2231182 RepID=UPI00262D679C|nr:M15 family metallopeptidase [Segetibacter sp.]MCW3081699.1 Peptidoglycan-binding domain 1 protein [Segetibacter sp.]
MIAAYSASNIIEHQIDTTKVDIFVDQDFVPGMDIMNEAAKSLGLEIIVISAKRDTIIVHGAIVEPAKMSNHLVGHAVDVNIIVLQTKEYYNSVKMESSTGVVRQFIETVKQKGLRWGGDFHEKDPVHFDDGLNIRNPEEYKQKINEYFGKSC